MLRQLLAAFVFALMLPPLEGHFSMLLPQEGPAKKGEPVTLQYQWGHPFEHQLFDAPAPAAFELVSPEGKKRNLTKSLEAIRIKGGAGKGVSAFRFAFTPDQRGDYTFILRTDPIWMEEDKEFLQDAVKLVLHVQAQKGWHVDLGPAFRMIPLTRPYGLRPGMVFQARVLDGPSLPDARLAKVPVPQPNLPVFIERYNATPPKKLPPDELITFVTRTDPNGVLTCTLPGSGWWSVTAQRDAGSRKLDGKDYPVRQRVTLWVFVDS